MRSDGAEAARLTPIAQCQANALRMVGKCTTAVEYEDALC